MPWDLGGNTANRGNNANTNLSASRNMLANAFDMVTGMKCWECVELL